MRDHRPLPSWLAAAGFAACLVLPLLAALGHDPGRSFQITPDQDLVHVYEALRMGQGMPQHYDDHTGYVSFLLLMLWLKVAKVLGLVAATRLDDLPPPGPAFDAAFQSLTIAGRWMSALLAAAFAGLMAWGLRRLTGGGWLALALALAFAASEGLVRQALILRTEMAAALFAFAAFFLVAEAARTPWRASRLLWAGLATMLSLMAKMQAVFVLAGLPVLALALGQRVPEDRRVPAPVLVTALWLLLAAAAALPAGMMVFSSIKGPGLYQGGLLLFVGAAMLAFARLYRIPADMAARGAAALILGLALGQLLHLVRHTIGTTEALVNFVEHMSRFSLVADGEAAGVLAGKLAGRMVNMLWGIPWRQYALLALAVGAVAAAARGGHRRPALAAALALGLGAAFAALSALRGYAAHYYVFTEGWMLVSVALAAGPMTPRPRAVVAALAGALALSQLPFLTDPSLVTVQSPENACLQAEYTTIRAGFCR